MNIDSCALPLSWYVSKDDFTGTCNDVKAPIADQRSSSTSVLVSDGTESEANTEKYAKSNSSLMYQPPV